MADTCPSWGEINEMMQELAPFCSALVCGRMMPQCLHCPPRGPQLLVWEGRLLLYERLSMIKRIQWVSLGGFQGKRSVTAWAQAAFFLAWLFCGCPKALEVGKPLFSFPVQKKPETVFHVAPRAIWRLFLFWAVVASVFEHVWNIFVSRVCECQQHAIQKRPYKVASS